ncbi:epoxide hydrolase family protein [Trebonia sp.]|uniref:epoxide hydrolase family protein n=1 Tax=Trebonia sp. TaxID=2767075 RepID=UPI002622CB03|nr:epoxide hydrolase family protein [Trebonia sp.]
MSTDTAAMNADPAIRPFHVEIADEEVADLRRRIAAWRPPEREPVNDQSQGVQLATVQDLASYWAADYDWRSCEAKLNALPQFITEIDGLDIHFIHVRSGRDDALPLIVTHGWPGSVIEQLKIIEPLTDPAGHGGIGSDAFDVVIPSLPGYGFSGKPAAAGWGTDRIARAWAVLMERLGYTRYVAQGGDWGTAVSAALARQAPAGLLGIHVNFAQMVPLDVLGHIRNGEPAPAGLSDAEKRAYGQVAFATYHRGYGVIQGTRPQTIGYSLADTPVGLAAWLLDHDSGTYAHLAQLFAGQPYGAITRDDWLDNTTLYWLTNTATSAARLYWQQAVTGQNFYAPADVSLPAAVTVFPEEYVTAPRSWTEKAYHKLIYFNQAGRGGHFAAWEQPQLLAEELRAAFRTLR